MVAATIDGGWGTAGSADGGAMANAGVGEEAEGGGEADRQGSEHYYIRRSTL